MYNKLTYKYLEKMSTFFLKFYKEFIERIMLFN